MQQGCTMGHCCHYGPFRYVAVAFPRLPGVLAANLRFRHQKSRKSKIPRFCARSQKDLLRKRYGSGRPDFLGNSEPPTMRGPAPAGVAKSATVLYKTSSCSTFTSRWTWKGSKTSHSVVQKHFLLLFEHIPRVKKNGEYWTEWHPRRKSKNLTISRWQKEP